MSVLILIILICMVVHVLCLRGRKNNPGLEALRGRYYAHRGLHDGEKPENSMAAFAGISKFYLAREFKKYVGYSPNNYLIHLRLTHAKQLLHTTNLPAYKIGILVGIPNEINFSRLFKKHTGTTPGIFRKTRR